MKHILMLATGGTIACRQTGHGLSPALTGEELLEFAPQLHYICRITVINPINVDSTDITVNHRLRLARLIWENRDLYDGFVVTHGTDTIGFTAAMLYHLLPNFPKPVILTGSLMPVGAPDSDADSNLLGAFRFACTEYAGVAAFVTGKLVRGNHLVKVDSQSVDAFRSVGAGADGVVSSTGQPMLLHMQPHNGEPALITQVNGSVMLLKLIPDLDPSIFDFLCKYDNVIIEAYGSGGIPTRLEKVLQRLISNGTKVYLTTQCIYGGTDLHKYKVGRRAEALGAVCLGERTTEDSLAAVMCNDL